MSGKFTIAYRQADMIAANWLMFRDHWLWKGAAKLIGGIAFLILALVAVFDWPNFLNDIGIKIFLAVGAGLANFLLVIICCSITIPLANRRQFSDLRLAGKTAEFTYDDEQLRITDANNDLRVSWADFRRWSESKSVLLVYRGKFLCHYVPKGQVEAEHVTAIRLALDHADVPRA